MVSVRFFCFQLFNYRNPIHQIHCSRQGNRKTRRNKRRDVEYHAKRDKKRKETNGNRSSKMAIKKSRVEEIDDEAATEAIGTLNEGRTRHTVADKYGPPLFQMGDVVTIMKDTTPGVHWRFSYDKVGKCELGFFQFEYFIYTTNRECFYLFQDVDTWNMYMRAWHGEKKKEKELERERMRKVNEKRKNKNSSSSSSS